METTIWLVLEGAVGVGNFGTMIYVKDVRPHPKRQFHETPRM